MLTFQILQGLKISKDPSCVSTMIPKVETRVLCAVKESSRSTIGYTPDGCLFPVVDLAKRNATGGGVFSERENKRDAFSRFQAAVKKLVEREKRNFYGARHPGILHTGFNS